MSYVGKPSDKFPYPIISDKDRKLSVDLGMVDPAEKDAAGMPLTARAVRLFTVYYKNTSSFYYSLGMRLTLY